MSMLLLLAVPQGATQLSFTTQPQAVNAGATMSAVVVKALTAGGVVDAGFTGTITVALTTPGGATLGGTVAVAAVAGVATFSTLSVDTAGAYTFSATATGLTSATSNWFFVGATLILRADTGVSSSSSLVDSWADQSPAGHNATAATTLRPLVTAVPDIDFDGTDKLSLAGFTLANNAAKTFVFVAKCNADGVRNDLIANRPTAGNQGWLFANFTDDKLTFLLSPLSAGVSGMRWDTTAAIDDTTVYQSWAVTHDGGVDSDSAAFYVNGAAVATTLTTNGTTTGTASAAALAIGDNVGAGQGPGGAMHKGRIAAVLVFEVELTAARMVHVHNALRAIVATFTTPISLPAAA